MEDIKWSEKVTYEQVFEHIGEKRTLMINVLLRKTNLIGHIRKLNCLLTMSLKERLRKWKE